MLNHGIPLLVMPDHGAVTFFFSTRWPQVPHMLHQHVAFVRGQVSYTGTEPYLWHRLTVIQVRNLA